MRTAWPSIVPRKLLDITCLPGLAPVFYSPLPAQDKLREGKYLPRQENVEKWRFMVAARISVLLLSPASGTCIGCLHEAQPVGRRVAASATRCRYHTVTGR